jgi:ketosteroid isomerase-like protein
VKHIGADGLISVSIVSSAVESHNMPAEDLVMIESPEQLHRAFQDAFNRQDLESIVALYEPGAVLASLNQPAQGTDAIRERYRGVLATHPSIDVRTLSVDVAGNLAMLHGNGSCSRPARTVANCAGRVGMPKSRASSRMGGGCS